MITDIIVLICGVLVGGICEKHMEIKSPTFYFVLGAFIGIVM